MPRNDSSKPKSPFKHKQKLNKRSTLRKPLTNEKQFSKATSTPKLVLFNKPFNTLCQFTGEPEDSTLAEFINIKSVYPAGRLDKDSEGLLLLTNDGGFQHKISHPKFKMPKTYWVQVEGIVNEEALTQLRRGVNLKDGKTKRANAKLLDSGKVKNSLWPRIPPIRKRQTIPTSWLELVIREGKNRQVRRMTAAVGHPTLRLVRVAIGPWKLDKLKPGEYRVEALD